MNRTGIVIDERFKLHRMEDGHPESPARVEALQEMLEDPELRGRLVSVPARPASREELRLVHSASYIERLERTEEAACTWLDPDTCTCKTSHAAARLAAGGLCEAIRLVERAALDNAFALVRPPGHHAERGRARGFCLYNNVAIGARYAQRFLGLQKILIVDWDLHHGNGTQHAFERDPSVLYFSVHQSPLFPGTGKLRQTGKGAGRGHTVNLPIPAGWGDGEYLSLFERILKPVALEFGPNLVLVSAGFDLDRRDPLGGMDVSAEGFAAMTRVVMKIADQCCRGKLVLTLEGGYDQDALRGSAKAVLKELAGLTRTGIADKLSAADPGKFRPVLGKAIKVHGRHWSGLCEPGPGTGVRKTGLLRRVWNVFRQVA